MKSELIVYANPKSPVSEMFRTLRTNLQFMSSRKSVKTMLITSTMPNEGKSWVSSNLAVTFAQSNKKVLLIDADMRKGRISNIFSVKSFPGLSNYLSGIDENGNNSLKDIAKYIQSTSIKNLYVMPAGTFPPNPSELLGQEKTIDLIYELRENFDIIIFDGTPSLLVTDALIIARIVDTTIIVAQYKETKKDNLLKIKKSIENVGGNVAGVVLNKIPVNTKKYNSSYYYSNTSISVNKKNQSDMSNLVSQSKNFNNDNFTEKNIPSMQKKEILTEIDNYLKTKKQI